MSLDRSSRKPLPTPTRSLSSQRTSSSSSRPPTTSSSSPTLTRLFDENHRLNNQIDHYREEVAQLHDRNSYLELAIVRLNARLMAAEVLIGELKDALKKEPPPIPPRRQPR